MSEMQKISILSATLEDIPQIQNLMDSIFGTYPTLSELLHKWIQEPDTNVVVAKYNNHVIATSTWVIKPELDLNRYEVFGPQALAFLKQQRSGLVLNLAVSPEFRRMNIGKQISVAQLAWLKQQNCDIIIGVNWDNGRDDNSRYLYQKAGFQKLGEDRSYLKKQLLQTGASCSVCQSKDCNCNSILYGIKLSELSSHI